MFLIYGSRKYSSNLLLLWIFQCYSKTKDIVCKSYMRTLNKQQEGKENKKLHSWGIRKGFLKKMRFEQSCEDFIMVYKNPNR